MQAYDFHPASFRDPDGRVFLYQNVLYRGISNQYLPHYQALASSGLLTQLQTKGQLIPHQVVANIPTLSDGFACVLQPTPLPFVSYPYEWSFAQYKAAALLTLHVQMQALEKGMTLKDASAYNVQFYKGKALLIDTTSFEIYTPDSPWVAYGQFCRHFLAPLLLMTKGHIDTHRMMQAYIDGLPLMMTSKLLPLRTWFSPFIWMHIHLHAKTQQNYANAEKGKASKAVKMPLNHLKGLIDSMINFIEKLEWAPEGTWKNYYSANNNYKEVAFDAKKAVIQRWMQQVPAKIVWDIGGNTGVFSHIWAKNPDIFTVCFDIDPAAVMLHYEKTQQDKIENVLPLLMDITQPSPAIGWANGERQTLTERGKPDVVMALALVHHLAIGNNVPLEKIAALFATYAPYLIIEFVPKSDSQVQKLLLTRKDIFDTYNIYGFEQAFFAYFDLIEKIPLEGAEREMYLFKRKM